MANYELPTTGDKIIWDTWMGQYVFPSVTVAEEMKLFSSLAEKPATIAELAQRLGYDRRAVAAVLRVLAANNYLIAHTGVFHLADAVRPYLLPEGLAYWGPVFIGHRLNQTHQWLKTWLTGKSVEGVPGRNAANDKANADRPVSGWASGQVDMQRARGIAAYMHAHSVPAAIGAARNGPFGSVKRLLDVGGGSGCFAIAMAQIYPNLRATIMELPSMCELALDYIKQGDVTARVDTVAVDMFRMPWPRGYDAMFFSNIFHDWDAETCEFLAQQSFDALDKGGSIHLHEMVLSDDGIHPATTAGFSMHMLNTQGQQYTFQELKAFLEKAGFRDVTARQTYSYYSVVTGKKP